MERLISLFKEPDYDSWSPTQAQPPPDRQSEPLYFSELLDYLRKERAEISQDEALQDEDAMEVCDVR